MRFLKPIVILVWGLVRAAALIALGIALACARILFALIWRYL